MTYKDINYDVILVMLSNYVT